MSKAHLVFLIFFSYCLIRYLIYYLFPVNDFSSWIVRDAVMNIPRLLGLILLVIYVIDVRKFKKELIEVSKIERHQLRILGLFLTPVILRLFSFEINEFFYKEIAILVFSTFIVSIFEETLFRYAFHDIFFKLNNKLMATIISALFFTVFHFQAQDFFYFGGLFFTGFLFSLLREDGVSLFWLVLTHFVYDFLILLWPVSQNAIVKWETAKILLLLILIFFLKKLYLKRKFT